MNIWRSPNSNQIQPLIKLNFQAQTGGNAWFQELSTPSIILPKGQMILTWNT